MKSSVSHKNTVVNSRKTQRRCKSRTRGIMRPYQKEGGILFDTDITSSSWWTTDNDTDYVGPLKEEDIALKEEDIALKEEDIAGKNEKEIANMILEKASKEKSKEKSFVLSSEEIVLDDEPFAGGANGKVYKATLNDMDCCCKVIQIQRDYGLSRASIQQMIETMNEIHTMKQIQVFYR